MAQCRNLSAMANPPVERIARGKPFAAHPTRRCALLLLLMATLALPTLASTTNDLARLVLDYDTPCDPGLQAQLAAVDARLRTRHGLAETQSAAGVLDLQTGRLALLRPDQMDYGASVPKVGILLAYFELRPATARALAPETRHELGLMIKQSSNELAAKYSRELGLRPIQEVLLRHGLYDTNHGGGLWVGKHYGVTGERFGDPLQDLSHAMTVRQVLRLYLWLEQDRLVSPEASRLMRDIFRSPEIPHREDLFVQGLADRGLTIRRKAGWWEEWFHDSAVIEGPGRHYLLVAMTHHARGAAYLADLAPAVDDLLAPAANRLPAK
jgi:beta-lactamase class A